MFQLYVYLFIIKKETQRQTDRHLTMAIIIWPYMIQNEILLEPLILDRTTNIMNNVKENVFIARNDKFRTIGESKHILCMIQQSLEWWIFECAHLDDKSLAILTHINNYVSFWNIFWYV